MLSMILLGLAVETAIAPQEAKRAPDPDKRICRTEHDTGSRMARRTCHTRAEWEALAVTQANSRDRFTNYEPNMAVPR